jgi:hypothetical protein
MKFRKSKALNLRIGQKGVLLKLSGHQIKQFVCMVFCFFFVAAAAAAAEASPESAYQSFDENALNAALSGQDQEADEPTRVVDLSQADQSQEYKV